MMRIWRRAVFWVRAFIGLEKVARTARFEGIDSAVQWLRRRAASVDPAQGRDAVTLHLAAIDLENEAERLWKEGKS